MRIENARIESTMLGIEDHGLMTCLLHLEFGGGAQSFGGYDLSTDHWSGVEFVRRILEAVGVSKWEDLKGKLVRVKRPDGNGPILSIGHILENRWFEPDELFSELKKRD